jgi:ATP-dependent Lon protease
MWNNKLPIIPLKNIVLFPNIVVPVFVGRNRSLQALLNIIKDKDFLEKEIIFVLQNNMKNDPTEKDFFSVGVVGNLTNIKRLDKSTYKIMVHGNNRVSWNKIDDNGKFFSTKPEISQTIDNLSSSQKHSYKAKIIESLQKYLSYHKNISVEIIEEMLTEQSLEKTIYILAHFLMFQLQKKQNLLEENRLKDRAEILINLLEEEIDIVKIEDHLHFTVKERVEKSQKEFYLKEKIKAIQEELGEEHNVIDETNNYENKINNTDMPDEIKKKALRETSRLKNLSNLSSESGIIKGYLEWLLELPWTINFNKDFINLEECRKTLSENHYGLDKVKERIIEFLGVIKLTGNVQGSILCLVGPSGVGKTSIARSIAKALNKRFYKISLGGLNDESELRGHRKTYVGAMPGRIIQAIHSTNSRDSVILLDEIDKLSSKFNSNPSAVLLEILDSEQNKQFYDYYLEVNYDISNILFIATANSTYDIPTALLDRMEVINLSGYSLDEKKKITSLHLWSKLLKSHGLQENEIELSENSIEKTILQYTCEAGLRQLERELSAIIRKMVLQKLSTNSIKKLSSKNIEEYLGIPKYSKSLLPDKSSVGTAIGLAYTERGGAVMPIEVSVFPGNGEIQLTGKLGEIMQESAQAAISYIRFISSSLDIKSNFYKENDIHIHVPENAVPKDGPSAGITIAIALISALTKTPINNNIAMTGEISLHGKILPVGGIREKLMAAEQYSIKTVFVPKENLEEVLSLKDSFLSNIQVIGIQKAEDIIDKTFVTKIKKKKILKKTQMKWLS